MRVHFQIEYENEEGGVESFSSIDPHSEDGKKFLHDLLDEYINEGLKMNPEEASFKVWGVCTCHD